MTIIGISALMIFFEKHKQYKILAKLDKNKKAFTLAEILITLSIIGVIASITISNVIQNYNKRVIVTKNLKFYAKLTEIFETDQVVNNYMSITARTNRTDASRDTVRRSQYLIDEFIRPNFQITRSCDKTERGCFAQNCYYLNNDPIPPTTNIDFSPCSSIWNEFHWGGGYYKYNIKGGYSISVHSIQKNVGDLNTSDGIESANQFRPRAGLPVTTVITLDVNGEKSPNTLGKDMFVYVITPEGVFPAGGNNSNDCNRNGKGITCASHII